MKILRAFIRGSDIISRIMSLWIKAQNVRSGFTKRE